MRPNGVIQSRNDIVEEPFIFSTDRDQETWEEWNYDKIEYMRQQLFPDTYSWWVEDVFDTMKEEKDYITVEEFEKEVYQEQEDLRHLDIKRGK